MNVFALWSILMVTDFGTFSNIEILIYSGSCGIIITYEFILGVVRVQDYFGAYYDRFLLIFFLMNYFPLQLERPLD